MRALAARIPWPARAGPHLAWAGPAVLTAAVAGYQAGRPGPWRDELATWSAATRSVPEIIDLGRHIDGVLVPYYLLMHVWIGWFGDAPLTMRLPSLFAMIALTAVVALLARHFWGAGAGFLAGLLFAVLPVVSRYAEEARGYALAALFTTLATLLLARALERPRWWRWFAYGICVLLAGLAHLLCLLILAGHLVTVAVTAISDRRRRALGWQALGRQALGRQALGWLPAAGLPTAVVLALVHDGLGQRGEQLSWLHRATLGTLTELPELLFGSAALGGAVLALAVFALVRRPPPRQPPPRQPPPRQPPPPPPRRWAGPSQPAGSDSSASYPQHPAVLLWATALLPIALLYAYDQLVTPLFVGRYLLFVVPLLAALAGAGLTALPRPAALATVLAIGLLGLPVQAGDRREHSPFDYAAAAAVIKANEQSGDGIVYAPRDGWQLVDTGLEYYLRGRAPRDVLLARGEIANASLWATECGDPATCLSGTSRVWVVAADNLDPEFTATATNQLSEAERAALPPYRQAGTWRVDGFTITLFERAKAS